MSPLRTLRISVALSLFVSASIAWGQAGRGDLNDDGAVDAKDALRLLQVVEGRTPATDRDKAMGDVYPARGTGERPFGDGELTRDDVVQMLRMFVGSIPRGEVTGEFEAPSIEDFVPHSGTIGTRVRIKGQSFVSGALGRGDILVLFGSVPAAAVTPVSATEVEATVPAGFSEGQIAVLTPGGEARSGRPFVVSAQITGRIELPATFGGQAVEVVSVLGDGAPAADGSFTAPAALGRPTMLAAVPKNRPNSTFLKFAVPDPTGAAPAVINARSTAAALVLMQPLFAMTDPAAQAQLIERVMAMPGLDPLAQVVEQVWSDSPDPLKDPRFSAADNRPRRLPDGSLETTMPAELPPDVQSIVLLVTPAGISRAFGVTRLAGRASGADFGAEPSADIIADGTISLAEALNWIQGKPCLGVVGPFLPPYDDRDADVVVTERNIYNKDNDGNPVYVRTDYALDSVTQRGDRGHPGTETAYVTLNRYHVVGGVVTPAGTYNLYGLDDPATTTIYGVCGPAQLPGMGKREEGDASGLTDNVGKDAADRVGVALTGPLILDLALDEPGAGGDTVDVGVPWGTPPAGVAINGDVTIKTDENAVKWTSFGSRGNDRLLVGSVAITGSRNTVEGLRSRGGIAVRGGSGNQLRYMAVSGVAKGLEISEGATGTRVNDVWVANCRTGIEISGAATRGNEVNSGLVGQSVDADGNRVPGPCDFGIIIEHEAQANRIDWSEIAYCTTVGVNLRLGATGNTLEACQAYQNDGWGILLQRGARNNTLLRPQVQRNKLDGIRIHEDDTDRNVIDGVYATENGGSGIVIEGVPGAAMSAQPRGNVIREGAFGENGAPSLLIKNLYAVSRAEEPSEPDPTVLVTDCSFSTSGTGGATAPRWPQSGIEIQNSQDVRLEGNVISGHQYGLELTGSQTTGNTVLTTLIRECGTGLYVALASRNTIKGTRVQVCAEGIRLAMGARLNELLPFPGFQEISNCQKGIVIGTGASENLLRHFWLATNKDEDILIQDEGTNANRIVRCFMNRLVVRDGPANTTIGSERIDEGCSIGTGTVPVGKPLLSIIRSSPAAVPPKGVFVYGTSLSGNKRASEGVLVDGAEDVQIGSEQGSGAGTVTGCAYGIRVARSSNVRVVANRFYDNGTSVRVEEGSQNVTVGGADAEQANTFSYGNDINIHVRGGGQPNVQVLNNRLYYTGGGGEMRSMSYSRLGILLEGGAQGVQIRGNNIRHHTEDGVRIQGAGTSGNRVEANSIAMNKGYAVHVLDGARANPIRDNSIWGNAWSNTGSEIVLEGGGNDEIPAPAITGFDPASQRVQGVVDGARARAAIAAGSSVDVFAHSATLGQARVAVAPVRSDGTWIGRLDRALAGGLDLVATVTDTQGNTSGLGPVFSAAGARPPTLVFTTTRYGDPEIQRLFAGEPVGVRLTFNLAADHSPVLSPDAARVAFVSERSGNADIWAGNTDGSGLVNLTNHAAADSDPAWSPDGAQVAFASNRDGNAEIYTMNADGTNVRRLTENPAADAQPAWTPSGGLVFASDRNGDMEVYGMRADGAGVAPLTMTLGISAQPNAGRQ
ncbi:MAG: right-handed parallel beta-helix repeat-containing protein [Armatimonadetes bacterium]|nr:right-handed parallel beta-helix repeat-containing protein [Armatimonadota bacterium]